MQACLHALWYLPATGIPDTLNTCRKYNPHHRPRTSRTEDKNGRNNSHTSVVTSNSLPLNIIIIRSPGFMVPSFTLIYARDNTAVIISVERIKYQGPQRRFIFASGLRRNLFNNTIQYGFYAYTVLADISGASSASRPITSSICFLT